MGWPTISLDPDGDREVSGVGDLELGIQFLAFGGRRDLLLVALNMGVPTGDSDRDLGRGTAFLRQPHQDKENVRLREPVNSADLGRRAISNWKSRRSYSYSGRRPVLVLVLVSHTHIRSAVEYEYEYEYRKS